MIWTFLKKLIIVCGVALIFVDTSHARFDSNYFGANYAVAGSNGIVTNDMSSISVEYQRKVAFIDIFPTNSEYHWYLEVVGTVSYYDLEDPLSNLGITDTAQANSDLKAVNYILELGIIRRQKAYSFIDWVIGARMGGFGVQTSYLSGQTISAQHYNVDSSTSMGLTISAVCGLTWNVSDNYAISSMLIIRKHYLSEFAAKDSVSSREYKYPDFTAIGLGLGISRGF